MAPLQREIAYAILLQHQSSHPIFHIYFLFVIHQNAVNAIIAASLIGREMLAIEIASRLISLMPSSGNGSQSYALHVKCEVNVTGGKMYACGGRRPPCCVAKQASLSEMARCKAPSRLACLFAYQISTSHQQRYVFYHRRPSQYAPLMAARWHCWPQSASWPLA